VKKRPAIGVVVREAWSSVEYEVIEHLPDPAQVKIRGPLPKGEEERNVAWKKWRVSK